jgi:hypothetical protein
MLTATAPFQHEEVAETTKFISACQYNFPADIKIAKEAKSLIQRVTFPMHRLETNRSISNLFLILVVG